MRDWDFINSNKKHLIEQITNDYVSLGEDAFKLQSLFEKGFKKKYKMPDNTKIYDQLNGKDLVTEYAEEFHEFVKTYNNSIL